MPYFDQAKVSSANVFRDQILIGKITRTKTGSVFEYNSEFLKKLGADKQEKEKGAAYHLPYSRPKIETAGVNLHPYFAGLLPEGLRLRALVQNTKTSEDDLLSLLIASGIDCIGDLSVLPEGVTSTPPKSKADINHLEETVFSDLFAQSISQKEKIDEINIPGIQNKVSAAMISFPLHGARDQHSYILKLTPPDKPKIVENEYFFLQMAKSCGLKVNEAKLVKDRNGETGLLIKRFDRIPVKRSHEVISIHQEDACQFLNRYPADKYRVALSEIAEGLSLCSAPIVEIGKLIRLKAFSYLIANGDLHAKNISIHTSPSSNQIEMTPCYDLLTTLPYGDQKMALKLDGKDDNLKRKNFINFGKRYDVKEPATRAILDEIYECAHLWIGRLEEIGFSEKKTLYLRRTMEKRRKDLALS